MTNVSHFVQMRGALSDIPVIPKSTIQTESGEFLELDNWLGRKQAFAKLAGRCSAADAKCLRQVSIRHRQTPATRARRQFLPARATAPAGKQVRGLERPPH